MSLTAPVPGPDAPGAMVAARVAEVGRRLQLRQAGIAEGMSELLARDVAGLDDDRQLIEMLYASVESNVSTIFHILSNDISLEHLQPTTAAVEYALRLAQRGIPGNSLRRAYHVGQDDLMASCYDEVQALDCAPELKVEVLHRVSQIAAKYIDWITQYVLQVYDDERQRWITASGNVHSSLINAMISGKGDGAESFTAETGYALDQFHVGVIVWTVEPDPGSEALMGLEQLVRVLGTKTNGVAQPIFTAVDRTTGWAWLPRGRDSSTVPADVGRELLAKTPGARIAFGLPAPGLAGFKRTHDQAEAARFVALASADTVPAAVGYGDPGVAIVSALARDIDTTRTWVSEVLGALAADTPNNGRLRLTLHTFLNTGGSFVQTAGLLNMHRNTVKYRVDKALELRGRPLGGDRLDVEMALQACQFLGKSVLQQG